MTINHLVAVDSNRHPCQGSSTSTDGQTIQHGATADVQSWVSYAGDVTGRPSASTVVDFTFAGETQGNILYRGASAWLLLAPGSAGQVLTSNGAAAPSWAAASSASDIVITDNVTNAFRVREAANEYINVNTTNGSEALTLGASGPNAVLSISMRNLSYSQLAQTSGAPHGMTITGGTHTGMTASTEVHEAHFSYGQTKEWATGAISTQRAIRMSRPTYAFVGASVITTAATLAINGAPLPGTNCTITNAYALYVESGESYFGGVVNFTTPPSVTGTSSLSFTVNSDATAGVNEDPSLVLTGGDGGEVVDTNIVQDSSADVVYVTHDVGGTRRATHFALGLPSSVEDLDPILYFNGGSGAAARQAIFRYDGSASEMVVETTSSGAFTIVAGLTMTIRSGASSQMILQGSVSAGSSSEDINLRSTNTRTAGDLITVANVTTNRMVVRYHGGINVTQGVATTGATSAALILTGGAHTGQTASAEIFWTDFNPGTVSWATGALTTQTFNRFRRPTIAFTGASTASDAYTVSVENSPAAGTNATITRSWALGVLAGNCTFAGSVIIGLANTAPDQTLDVRSEISIFGSSNALARLRLRGWYAASPSDPPTDQTDIMIVDTGAAQVLRVRYNDAGTIRVGDLALI